ncbi:MAG: penicillin-binding transpeptidase domain-containing protein [Candidatus Saccharibacteria bacterium]|nr:penicillin-binding transpeptidase domain-containing protein [Candidatus Saccharibacteria bacterium]
MSSPLVFIQDRQSNSRYVQLWFIGISLVIGVILQRKSISRYVSSIPKNVMIAGIILIASILISLARNFGARGLITFGGYAPEYIGYSAWFIFVAGALLFAKDIRTYIFSSAHLILSGLVLLVSVLTSYNELTRGVPLRGLLYSPLAMATFANITLVLCILRYKESSRFRLLFGLSIILLCGVILATQTIVGIAVMVLVLVVSTFIWLQKFSQRVFVLIFVGSVMLIPSVFPGYFWHLRNQEISGGVRYQTTLITEAVSNASITQILFGRGAKSLPKAVDNHNFAEAEIVKSLDVHTRFIDNHSLFFDIFYYFGTLGFVSFLFLNIIALNKLLYLRKKDNYATGFGVIYLILLTYTMVAMPSLYLSLLYLIVLLAMTTTKLEEVKRHKKFHVLMLAAPLVLAVGILFVSSQPKAETKPIKTSVRYSTNQPFTSEAERVLQKEIQKSFAVRGCAILMDAHNGEVVSMVDAATNQSEQVCVSAWEPGSVIKPLLVATAIEKGTTTPNTTFYDPGYVYAGERIFLNAESYDPGPVSTQAILDQSRNTGAIHIFNGLGKTPTQARDTWHNSLTGSFKFGKKTGFDIHEASGYIRNPKGGNYIEEQFAASSFGVGMTITPLQLAAAYAPLANGGMYVTPHKNGTNVKDATRVLSSKTSNTMQNVLKEALTFNNKKAAQKGFALGGKTGTAPIVDNDGAYKISVDDGVYVGFVGKDTPKYIMVVRVDEPMNYKFASYSARDTWAKLSDYLLSNDLN